MMFDLKEGMIVKLRNGNYAVVATCLQEKRCKKFVDIGAP